MRALDIVHNQIRQSTDFMHAARWAALWRTVQALISGKKADDKKDATKPEDGKQGEKK